MRRFFIIIIVLAASIGVVWGLNLFSGSATLLLNIPIEDMKGKLGKVDVRILDPDDQPIGHAYRYIYVNKDYYSLPVKVKLKEEPIDYDLLRAEVEFKGKKKVYSLHQLEDRMVVKILGQNEFIKGTPINYRIIVRNQRNNEPIKGAQIKIILKSEKKEKTIYKGITDGAGTCQTDFEVPDEENEYDLHFEVTSNLGEDTYDTRIKILSGNLTYLVTDKPIYQPGQTIHIRSLSLRKPALTPVEDEKILYEIEDSKGNKIFKKTTETDDFGIGYVQFLLADELNFGDYTIRIILDKGKVEKTVRVEKYVLPKFKIELSTDKEFYLPGEKLEGNVDIQYFFGKPVVDGKVKITTYKFDIGFQAEAVIEGKTDNNGKYHFVYNLPGYFVGEPLEKGDAFMRLDVEVIDKANHSEKISLKKKIVQDVISLSIVPEGGMLKPNLENRIFVLANYPDGTPCHAQVEMKIDGKRLSAKTDDYGITEFSYKPTNPKTQIEIKAKDDKGESATLNKQFTIDLDRDQIIMRMARGIYKVGEIINLQFLSTRRSGRVYFDVIKNNQTVLTKSVTITNGKGTYNLNLTTDMAGSIWLHAYIVTPGSDIVRDTRFCYVHAANDLSINVKPDKVEYLPGGEGRILFTVTDQNNRPRVAALCVAIVDEAVFAVSELQPGLEKVYFTLEEEIMKPRYEIHGFEPMEIVRKERIEARAENVMFSTLVPKDPFRVNYTTPQEIEEKIKEAFSPRLLQARDKIYEAINKYHTKHKEYPRSLDGLAILIAEGFLKEKTLLDPWTRRYRINTSEDRLYWFNIVSAGPDGVFDNEDDITEQMMRHEEIFLLEAVPRAAKGVAEMVSTTMIDKKKDTAPGEPRIREFFPETFVFEPALITDLKGEAMLSVTMPDAITTWRITASASSQKGELGSTLAQLRVFQDFFVDIDLPVVLTEGDEISIPVAVYNYLPREQNVKIVLEKDEWFDILGKQEISKLLKKDEVSVIYFPIRAKGLGNFSLLVKAYGEVMSDAIKRQITVLPDGKRFEDIISDRLEGQVVKNISFPHNAIKGAHTLILKIFPGIYSQVAEGLDKLLGVPFGCFEQTTSVTYPNILILDYLRQTEQIKADIEMTAEEYISLGYQRLLSFEVEGGGFSWFGDAPANKVLTAYGLMEFNDMAKVYDIDERLIQRTVDWLKKQQQKDGSWSPDQQYLHAESWGRIQKNEILPTAYIVWALGEIGERGSEVSRGFSFLKNNLKIADEPYILALIANAFVTVEPRGATTNEVLKKLVDLAHEKDGAIYWESNVPSITLSRGLGADIEATGLATYALIRSGKYSDLVSKALTYLIRAKDAAGLWYTTQGTIIALRSMVAALGGVAEDIDAQISVMMSDQEVRKLNINKDNADLMHQIELTDYLSERNRIEIRVRGEGNFLYEITRAYYIPWKDVPLPSIPPFTIDVDYDRTSLTINDIVNVDVSIKLNRPGTAQMVMVDLAIPPGFEIQTPTLDELVGKKIQKYSLTPRQLIIYLDEVSSSKPVEFSYSIKAKYPIKAQVRSSRVYEYYNTADEAIEEPIEMKVSM